MKRTVFILSDRTGITTETLSHCLLTQFDNIEFTRISIPFIDSIKKAENVVEKINKAAIDQDNRPLVFSTLISPQIRTIVKESNCFLVDFFDAFINPLEEELETESAHAVGKTHGVGTPSSYKARIEAINFAMSNDDGASTQHYEDADIILIGASRSAKTPTCIYLALNYGIYAANYPITDEDLESSKIPPALTEFRSKLFGLTIEPVRLHQIRSERRPNSYYSSLSQCTHEIQSIKAMYQKNNIPYIDTSLVSIEEIAATIVHQGNLKRRIQLG
jgi:hypothetical protein